MHYEVGYVTADELFRGAEPSDLFERVCRERLDKSPRDVPFCETLAGQEAVKWSGLSGTLDST